MLQAASHPICNHLLRGGRSSTHHAAAKQPPGPQARQLALPGSESVKLRREGGTLPRE